MEIKGGTPGFSGEISATTTIMCGDGRTVFRLEETTDISFVETREFHW